MLHGFGYLPPSSKEIHDSVACTVCKLRDECFHCARGDIWFDKFPFLHLLMCSMLLAANRWLLPSFYKSAPWVSSLHSWRHLIWQLSPLPPFTNVLHDIDGGRSHGAVEWLHRCLLYKWCRVRIHSLTTAAVTTGLQKSKQKRFFDLCRGGRRMIHFVSGTKAHKFIF